MWSPEWNSLTLAPYWRVATSHAFWGSLQLSYCAPLLSRCHRFHLSGFGNAAQRATAAAMEACWWPVYMALHILEDTIGDLEPQPRRYIHTLGRFVPHAGYLLYENPLSNWRLLKKGQFLHTFVAFWKRFINQLSWVDFIIKAVCLSGGVSISPMGLAKPVNF